MWDSTIRCVLLDYKLTLSAKLNGLLLLILGSEEVGNLVMLLHVMFNCCFRCWNEPRRILVPVKRWRRGICLLFCCFPGHPSDHWIYGLSRGKLDPLLLDPTWFTCIGNLGLVGRSRFGSPKPWPDITLFWPWYSIRISRPSVVYWHRYVAWLIFRPFRRWPLILQLVRMFYSFMENFFLFSSFFFNSAEHHVLYQYNIVNAANHYMGLIQTETVSPYFFFLSSSKGRLRSRTSCHPCSHTTSLTLSHQHLSHWTLHSMILLSTAVVHRRGHWQSRTLMIFSSSVLTFSLNF